MTVDELLALLSPTTLVNLLIDLDDADGERTPDEVHVMYAARYSLMEAMEDRARMQLYGTEKDRRNVQPIS